MPIPSIMILLLLNFMLVMLLLVKVHQAEQNISSSIGPSPSGARARSSTEFMFFMFPTVGIEAPLYSASISAAPGLGKICVGRESPFCIFFYFFQLLLWSVGGT